MSFSFTINGISYNEPLELSTLSISHGAEAQGASCEFSLFIETEDLLSGLYPAPVGNMEVDIILDGTRLFRGIILEVSTIPPRSTSYVEYKCQCTTFAPWLDVKLIATERPSELAGTRIKAIVSYIRSYVPDFPFTTDGVEDGFIVEKAEYDYVDFTSILSELAEACQYQWRVDFDKDIQFFAQRLDPSPIDGNVLDMDSELAIGDIVISEDTSQIKNRIYIKNFSQKGENKYTDGPFTPGDNESFFKLQQPPFDVESVEVNVEGESEPRIVKLDPLDGSDENIIGKEGEAYVCLLPGSLVTTKRGIIPIEDVVPGDYVIAASGKWQRVSAVMAREYSGKVFSINRHYYHRPLNITAGHPVLAVKRNNCLDIDQRFVPKNYIKRPYPKKENAQWVMSEDLEPGDFLVEPASLREEKSTLNISEEFAYVCGLYLAEGYTNNGAILFAMHRKETDAHNKISEQMFEVFGANTSVYKSSDNGVIVSSCSVAAEPFFKQFGEGAKNKHIPDWVFELPDQHKLKFLKGYFDGDGCYHKAKIIAATVSMQLAYDLHRLLLSVGILSYIQYKENTVTLPQGTLFDRFIYEIHITGQHADIARVLWRMRQKDSHKIFRAQVSDGYGFYEITDIMQDMAKDIIVYDLTIENEHSFMVENVICHNCIYNMGIRFPTVDLPDQPFTVSYNPEMPDQVAMFEDPLSIRYFRRIEGSSGVHEFLASAAGIKVENIDPIAAMGEYMLRRYAWPLITVSISTYETHGWETGQFFYLHSDTRDIYDYKLYESSGVKQDIVMYVQKISQKVFITSDGYLLHETIEATNVPYL